MQTARRQGSRVGSLHQVHPRVAAELVCDLSIAGVDGQHRRRTVLQEAVGKAARGGTDICACQVLHVQMPGFQCALELKAATGDIAQILAQHADGGIGRNRRSRLVELLLVNQHPARKNEGLGTLPRSGQAAFYQQLVETKLRNSGHTQ